MSTFSVSVKRIRAIEPHPAADAIEFAVVDGYRAIVKKGEFRADDHVAYIPEAALLPEWLLRRMGFWDAEKGKGRLSGAAGNRVTAIRLRGALSQGLCYPVGRDGRMAIDGTPPAFVAVNEGDNVTPLLGIAKYEPPVPLNMAGDVFSVDARLTLAFDVENWKAFPEVLQEGEPVIFTEKLHGTFTGIAVLPYADAHPEAFGARRNILIFSKGLGAKGLVFKSHAGNAENLYVRATRKLVAAIDAAQEKDAQGPSEPFFILGETYGAGVQDLAYSTVLGFRVFASATGYRGAQRYTDWDVLASSLCPALGLETVPVLYRGPFSEDLMRQHMDGKTSLGEAHMREGIVMLPTVERLDPRLGRVCLKAVSADYLTRRGGTEYN